MFQEDDQNLVRAGRVSGAPRRGHDGVCRLAIGNDGRASFERDACALPLDRRCAVANIAAAVAFGGRGREQHLLAAESAHQQLMPGAAAAVSRYAGHLGLVHGVDHGGGGACPPKRVTDVGDLGNAGALAAKFTRYGNAQQALLARGSDRLRRKTQLGIDRGGMRGRDRRNLFGARRKVFAAAMVCRNIKPRAGLRETGTPCSVAVRTVMDAFASAIAIQSRYFDRDI